MQPISDIITEIQEINNAYFTLHQQGIQPKHLETLLHDLVGDLASALDVEVVTEHGDIAMMRPRAAIIAELSGINKSYVTLQQQGIQSKRVKASFRGIVRELASTFLTFAITEHKPSTTSDHEAPVQPALDGSQEPAPTSDHEASVEPPFNIANEPVPTTEHKAATGVTKEDQVTPKKPQGAASNAQEAWSDMQERGWHKHKISWANLMLWDMCFGDIYPSDRHKYEVVCSMIDREMLRMSQQSTELY